MLKNYIKNLSVTILSNKNKGCDFLYLKEGDFKGDKDAAMYAINNFSLKNKITYESFDDGYGILFINDNEFDVGPEGIDITTMLVYCNLNLDLDSQRSMLQISQDISQNDDELDSSKQPQF